MTRRVPPRAPDMPHKRLVELLGRRDALPKDDKRRRLFDREIARTKAEIRRQGG